MALPSQAQPPRPHLQWSLLIFQNLTLRLILPAVRGELTTAAALTQSASEQRTYERCLRIATTALSGETESPIGNRALFFHPTGLPRPKDGVVPKGRFLMDTVAGERCAPGWGNRSPLTVGHAIFCGDP